MNRPRTLFYSYGPAQSSGPDLALDHGVRVTMLSYEYGFSHVAIQSTGQAGYLPTEDLAPAPPLPKSSPSVSSAASHSRHRHGGQNSLPPTAGEEGQIPLPEFPESKPPPGAPAFRY